MTHLIAEAFKALFGLMAFVAVVLILVGASIAAMQFGPVAGVAGAIGGLLVVVSLLGVIALQIQNNKLLKLIADASKPKNDAASLSTPLPPSGPSGQSPARKEPRLSRSDLPK